MEQNMKDKRERWTIVAVVTFVALLIAVLLGFAGKAVEQATAPDGPVSTALPDDPKNMEVETPKDWPTAAPAPKPTTEGVKASEGEGAFPSAEDVNRSDPDAVAERFAVLSASFDTMFDENESAALRRAEPLMGEELVQAQTAPARDTPWVDPRKHQAYSLAAAQPLQDHMHEEAEKLTLPGTGEELRPYTMRVSYKWQGRDGWISEEPEFRTVFLSLVERDGQWVVAEYGYRSMID